ncbi:DNA-processing protein DprA [Rheinheimera baltica]|uniref:DNA-processing protein DprA n=1 Tax=Rheinheimera baltica TaxID=67576 RepID=A0ABT9HXX9_9GAMM|nr:DNA-processing protein DprA [Rheinheimera baltica]MDP5135813.1 DNA-processing protein DprA [Rheinheimera baltica]MDP5143788.1 DNA-processing protein DprA [Rheinheimera baltica]MDP5151831.1 DNA-processing protein DprA [Rheinheimera baltica]
MEDIRNWLALASVHGLDGLKFQRLSEQISAAELVKLPASTLRNIGFTERQAHILAYEANAKADYAIRWLEQAEHHHIVTFNDPIYPALLKQTKQPPLILFVKGDPHVLAQQQLAMVGSRQPTPTGRKVAFNFASELSQQGYVITSGMARGIDSESHKGALHVGGLTIAVLGHGLEQVYPVSNKALATAISEQGALVSEYFPDVQARAELFPQRNRIVVGLSIGTIVVEAGLKSGTLISANLAAEYSRDVFAVPGSVYSPQSAGCHSLIQQGAKLVTSVADILEEWRFFGKTCLKIAPEAEKSIETDLFARQLLANVGDEVTAVDLIAERAGVIIADATIALLQLELAGEVAAVPGGYIRVRSA